jgi:microcystin-dependent protein
MLFLTQSSNLFFEADEHLFLLHNGQMDYLQNSNELRSRLYQEAQTSNYVKLKFTSNVIQVGKNVDLTTVSSASNLGSFSNAWKSLSVASDGVFIENKNINYSSLSNCFNVNSDVHFTSNVFVSGLSLIPIGTIFPYAGITVLPEDYLWCDGGAYSRTVYQKLFNVIGTTYGSGDNISTFNVPNLKIRTLMGAGAGPSLTPRTLGGTAGQSILVLSTNELPSHTHNIVAIPSSISPLCVVKRTLTGDTNPNTYKNSLLSDPNYGDISGTAPDVTAVPYGFIATTDNRGGVTSIGLRHPYTVVQHIIKYQ